jgi:hypothetical protein
VNPPASNEEADNQRRKEPVTRLPVAATESQSDGESETFQMGTERERRRIGLEIDWEECRGALGTRDG